MKYIDNIIDWGDHLFAQDTRESINEAEMLYQLADDILGKHPVKMGECETTDENDLTYERIGPQIDQKSEFLITLENYHLTAKNKRKFTSEPIATSMITYAMLGNVNNTETLESSTAAAGIATTMNLSDGVKMGSFENAGAIAKNGGIAKEFNSARDYKVKSYPVSPEFKPFGTDGKPFGTDGKPFTLGDNRVPPKFPDKLNVHPYSELKEEILRRHPAIDYVKQIIPTFELANPTARTMVFCVPSNTVLLEYWDRVEDRLFKIRHCMNISGVRRSLALFQPRIDPMMLVRARAAGLSLEDITEMLAGARKTPNYRFSYLIEKAKQFTQTVQSFGSALLSALEKKDSEELTLLRSVHERNILRMTTDIKKKQLQESQYQYQAMEETLANVQNRIDYYNGLVGDGLTGWEVTQQASLHTSTDFKRLEVVPRILAGIFYLIPQIGSFFALKFGGKEMGDSSHALAEWFSSMASIENAISASAGLEATFQRREQEWKQQLKLAQQELKQIDKQVRAAEIRSLIAEKDLEIHEKNIEHADELDDFYKNKFTNLGLYNYLSSTLNRLYREAYNVAYDMAKMAERAYQFEQDESAFFIANDNWQFDRAGLLAGERLLLQLQKMEQAYIENNVRTPEITQSFSLALLNASQLVQLRQTGSCVIKIPEIAFDMVYPGQYKRLIKSVRLTIPCVVGPYTNVSAKLTLTKGEVKKADPAVADPAELEELPVGENTSISTSSASNDTGMFEFSFRDERYLPFEGSGAISEWRLELPSKIRSFNYDTISDVILHISYTAREGNREFVEDKLAKAITDYAMANGLFRLFSLKHEFPNAFHQLLNPAAGATQTTEFLVEKSHFPYPLADFETWNIAKTKIYLKPKKGLSLDIPATMKINGTEAEVTWSSGDDIKMPDATSNKDTIRGGAVELSGNPIETWTINAGNNGLDKDVLDDILILVKYSIS
ncbi:MAG: hypothetical protein AAB116_11475 [Candidatus Poribacteria bacterium]